MKETVIRHLKSAGVTFIGFFLFAFFGALSSDGFVFSKATTLAAAFAAIIAGIRAGAKILVELGSYFISYYKKP